MKYEEIRSNCGTGMSKDFYDWIDTAIKFTNNNNGRKDGKVEFHFDYDYNELSRLTFFRVW